MPQIEPFEKNVDIYETWFERNRVVYESELKALVALLPKSGNGLEVGVGTGRFSAPMGIGIGVDPSLAMGKVACKRDIKLLLGVGEHLPCKSNHFDFIIFVTTICFLDDVAAALREAYRVLKSRGHILIGFIDRDSFLGKVYEERKDDDVFYRYANFLTVDELVSHLTQTGFYNFEFLQTIFKHPSEMEKTDSVKSGYGEGSFVVVRGRKNNAAHSR